MSKHYYEILGVNSDASSEEIEQAYQDLVELWEPERFNDNPRLFTKAQEKLKEITLAHKALISVTESRDIPYKPDPERFIFIGKNDDGSSTYLDKNSLADQYFTVFTYSTCVTIINVPDKNSDAFLKTKELLKQNKQNYDDLEYIEQNWNLDWWQDKYLIDRLTYKGKNAVVLLSATIKEPEWKPITPDSIADKVRKLLKNARISVNKPEKKTVVIGDTDEWILTQQQTKSIEKEVEKSVVDQHISEPEEKKTAIPIGFNFSKIIIAGFAGIMVLMGLFPPWALKWGGRFVNKGYAFILNPPVGAEIDFTRLLIQWFVVAIIGSVFFYILKDRKPISIKLPRKHGEISWVPLAFIFMTFGLGIGAKAGRLLNAESPSMAAFNVFLMTFVFCGIGCATGFFTVKMINTPKISKKQKLISVWIAGIVGFVLFFVVIGLVSDTIKNNKLSRLMEDGVDKTVRLEEIRRAGYSNREIANYLASTQRLDIESARTAGLTDTQIIELLLNIGRPKGPEPAPAPPNKLSLIDDAGIFEKPKGKLYLKPVDHDPFAEKPAAPAPAK